MVGFRHDAGVVVEDIQLAVRRDRVVDHGARVGLLRHVRPDECRLPAGGRDLVDGLAACRFAVLGHDDLGAVFSEHPRRDAAHPTAAPGDDRDLVGESHPGWSSLSRASYSWAGAGVGSGDGQRLGHDGGRGRG